MIPSIRYGWNHIHMTKEKEVSCLITGVDVCSAVWAVGVGDWNSNTFQIVSNELCTVTGVSWRVLRFDFDHFRAELYYIHSL